MGESVLQAVAPRLTPSFGDVASQSNLRRRPTEVPERDAPVADDRATFSPEALAPRTGPRIDEAAQSEASTNAEQMQPDASSAKQGAANEALSDEEQQQVTKLKQRDAEVRAHEAAHLAAGGAHVRGGATYTYQQGPDGKAYAIGGEVGIDVSSIPGNPQATIAKMQQVRAAALAPAEPSGADRAVASAASQAEAQAREALAAKQAERVTSRYGAANGPDTQGSQLDALA